MKPASPTDTPTAAARTGRKSATVGRPRKTDGNPEASARILDAAEDLFSKHGFYGVTMRAVAAHAQVDTALAHYYFGTKQGLFDAVCMRRADIVNAERVAAMDAYAATAGASMTVEGVIAAFLAPLLAPARHADPGWKNYFSLIAQLNNTNELGGATMTRYFDPVVTRLIDLLQQVMPQARREDLYWSYHMLTGSLTLTLSDTGRLDRLSNGLCKSSDIAAIAPRMIEYCAAGFKAVCLQPGSTRQ
ncbi:TetR family transcriptional regulator [Massilia agilis]|uniref:TetR family transcriptional regulator n=1 Tax=Massilia agilis TaxID=1811226 RepID=A0ABT2DA94_9BURK|nr:TetR family transcriptional regulator [Massilia agilis]